METTGKVLNMRAQADKTENTEPTVPTVKKHHFDFPLFIVLMLICAFGMVMLFSASYYYAQNKFGDGLYYVKDQVLFFAAGLAALLVISHIKYSIYKKYAWVLYFVLIAALAVTLTPLGKSANGAQRWIQLPGGFRLQPAELSKVILVILYAAFMTNRQTKMTNFWQGVVPVLFYMLIPCVLIILQPNLSMVIIIAVMTVLMLYLGGAKGWHLGVLAAVGLVGLGVLIVIAPYRFARFKTFLDPFGDPSDSGYQIVQSLYAFGNGGLFGQGINYSRQKLLFLPYRESDFILSIIGEELGFVGCLGLMIAYMFVIYRGIRIAQRCRDRFGSLLAAGITSVLAIQVLINVGVVTSSIPATGQTLPFISAGGTSMIVFMASMGILLNISRYTEVKAKND